MGCDDEGMTTAEAYAKFGSREARGVSPTYERLSQAVAHDDDLLALLDGLATGQAAAESAARRRPLLLGGPVDDPVAFHDYVLTHWPAIEAQMLTRATQTNEAGRCAVLLPVSRRAAAAPRPAGGRRVGRALPLPTGTGTATAIIRSVPVSRSSTARPRVGAAGHAYPGWCGAAGLDLNPLDVTDPDDVSWLDALIWPEQAHRRARLRAAAAVAAADPPLLVRGDLVDDLPALAARAPADATLVVFHTSVLYQVRRPHRDAFVRLVRELPGHWVANEGSEVLRYDALPEPPNDAHAQRSRARREAAGLGQRPRPGDDLVRLTGAGRPAGRSTSRLGRPGRAGPG